MIEHRRHTMRVMPGKHLSQAGVDLARRVGATLGSFDLVVTSTIPRAFETAIAMGFAVDEQLDELAVFPDGVEAEVGSWDAGFTAFADVARRAPDGVTARFASDLASLHARIAGRIPDGGRALIVSHGAVVEASAVGCMPDADFATWGSYADYCEGVRLSFDSGGFTGGEPLRVE